MENDSFETIDDIINLYKNFGQNDYIGEDITQTEHAIQTALLAEVEGYGNEVIVSALLHDIGHLLGLKNCMEQMKDLGTMGHENIGKEFLKKVGMSDRVCHLVKNHVSAKRYLVTKNENYYETLSDASKGTLKYQGGKMSEDELNSFEKDADFEIILKMRNWDDAAKIKDLVIPPFSDFKGKMEACLSKAINA